MGFVTLMKFLDVGMKQQLIMILWLQIQLFVVMVRSCFQQLILVLIYGLMKFLGVLQTLVMRLFIPLKLYTPIQVLTHSLFVWSQTKFIILTCSIHIMMVGMVLVIQLNLIVV